MQYLLDTDWVIHCLHERPAGDVPPRTANAVGLGIVSMAELYQGVFFSTAPQGNERALREILAGIDIMMTWSAGYSPGSGVD